MQCAPFTQRAQEGAELVCGPPSARRGTARGLVTAANEACCYLERTGLDKEFICVREKAARYGGRGAPDAGRAAAAVGLRARARRRVCWTDGWCSNLWRRTPANWPVNCWATDKARARRVSPTAGTLERDRPMVGRGSDRGPAPGCRNAMEGASAMARAHWGAVARRWAGGESWRVPGTVQCTARAWMGHGRGQRCSGDACRPPQLQHRLRP